VNPKDKSEVFLVDKSMESLNTFTRKIFATGNTDALLDLIFRHGLEISGAPGGAIYQRGLGDPGELVFARQRGIPFLNQEYSEIVAVRSAIAESVFTSGKAIVIEDGVLKSGEGFSRACAGIHALMATPLIVCGKTFGVFIAERDVTLPLFSVPDLTRLELIVLQGGASLSNAYLRASIDKKTDGVKMRENYLKTIRGLAIAIDAKNNFTRGHSEKVMAMAVGLAREMKGFDDQLIAVIRDAALLHDIGKISIPGHILDKPGPLSFEEFDGIMKKHSVIGANIVKDVPFLNELYSLILHHHEHYDGSGYPQGLKGDAIPLGARILHVADAFDAMASDRPYRSSLGKKEALRRIVADSGTHFDPDVAGVFVRVVRCKGTIE
jgi:putative nucleotidyltransferase with HDIG domain